MYYMVIVFQLLTGDPLISDNVIQSDNLMTLEKCKALSADFIAQMAEDKERGITVYCVGPVNG